MFTGTNIRPKKLAKGGTTSTRKHRFESFNQRIAKLNIDPIRRRRRDEVQDDDLTASASFFKTSLDRWKDLNLSENFAGYVRATEPLCNSLPQILHHHQRIFEILVTYIGKRDPLSLEPLLDLLSSFTHDLGARFEEHFSQAVTLVASLAAKHQAVEVVEWSFTCLAWLFKYLSRLLVPDLRPVFHIMAPLLGREPQKLHTTRFAAEAMSFLVRKAALMYHKDPRPLEIVMNTIRDDILAFSVAEGNPGWVELYKYGLMTLLFGSIKGIDRKLHSCGTDTYRCAVNIVLLGDESQNSSFTNIVDGVTIALVHHTDAAGFRPVLDVVLEKVQNLDANSSGNNRAICGCLLFTVATVRKGTRIKNWDPVLDAMLALLKLCDVSNDEMITHIYRAVAVILQSSPLDLVIPRFRLAMDTIGSDGFAPHFLSFCNYFCDLGRKRFHDLLLPYFYNFIATNWYDHELQLCVSVPKILGDESQKKMKCPDTWQESIVRTFSRAIDQDDLVVRCYSYLDLVRCLSIAPETTDSVMKSLEDMIQRDLYGSSPTGIQSTFSLGAGLLSYSQSYNGLGARLSEWWPRICDQAASYRTLPAFLEALLAIVKHEEFDLSIDLNSLALLLVENLHSASHSLRKISLQILDELFVKEQKVKADTIAIALTIEDSTLDLQSARSISMHIRKLSSLYEAASCHEWLRKAIPHFCFGLLSYKLSQAGSDAIIALKEICETKTGEDVVSEVCFRWLEEQDQNLVPPTLSNHTEVLRGPLTEFQCSNFIHVGALIDSGSKELREAPAHLRNKFDAAHSTLIQHVVGAPALALQVLSALPHIAEKRSRHLVPIFLSWSTENADEDAELADDIDPLMIDQTSTTSVWNLRDRKAMLNLFSCFTNPKMLYRSSEVYDALRELLVNGDIDIQRSALKAIFTWKIQEIQPYQENLLNLLDDAQFREEISTFLHVNDESSIIQNEHRPVLMPVLLRLLYGRMIARTGMKSGSLSQAIKRRAVLEALSRFNDNSLQDLVHIVLGPLGAVRLLQDSQLDEQALAYEILSTRKQLGMVNMVKDMLEILGNKLSPFAQSLTGALLYMMIRAARNLSVIKEGAEQSSSEAPQVSLLRAVRQIGLQCLNLLCRCCPAASLRPYMPTIFAEVISPRIDRLAIETAQSVSGTLQLFSTMASSNDTVLFLVDFDLKVLKSVTDCLEVPSAKEEVKLFVLEDILKKIVSNAKLQADDGTVTRNETVIAKVLQPNIDGILNRTGALLRRSPSKELLGSAIQLVSLLAPLVAGSSQTESLLEISTFLLDQPSQRVSPRSKSELLQIIQHFVPLVGAQLSSDLLNHMYLSVSSLFGYFKDPANRSVLSKVLTVLAERDPELQGVAQLCVSLNAFSARKLDEPDFDERLKAFDVINEEQFRDFTPRQWRPILYNMLFYVGDNEELAIRSNASFSLRRFVEMNVMHPEDKKSESADLVKAVLLPTLRTGVSISSEIVRAEYLSIMAHMIRLNPLWQEIRDMTPLLVDDDEEASFFANVLHIQQHRRLRALRRLALEAHHGHLRSANVAHFFIPLLEHFVFDKADDESAHNLSAETVTTIGVLASSLEWPQFRAIFRRFTSYIQSKPDLEKTVVRLLGVVIDALSQAYEERETISEPNVGSETGDIPTKKAHCTLYMTMPRQAKLAEDLSNNLLPSLLKFLHDKDESTVSLRVPVAVSVVKLLKLLPSDRFRERLPPMLTDVCHILRSRAQEARDLTRKTLVEISTMIGPSYFGFVMKELRGALARGYQLHVLSFTVHSILVATASIFKPGDLDYCLPQIVSVVMDDIFGATGQQKDAEEYISKMKEVKSSKSYDSMELVAKTATVENIVHLIRPLQTLLEEKLDLRMVKKIDELLRRIGVGLLRNEAILDQRVLIFCHELIHEVYKTDGPSIDRNAQEDHRTKRFLINYKGASKGGNRGSTTSYHYKLARFALDILRSVLHKHDVLQTPSNLAGFIPIIGDAIIQSNEEVQTSALRLLTIIIKVPLKAIDDNAAIYVAECVKAVKSATSTNNELAQAALKLVSAILRERRTVEIRETDLAYLLKRLIPDLEEPEKQGIAFNFLKAIMTRKIVITEVYEVLDAVAVIMVTNQTKGARDMARGAYFHFIMEYPQSKDRFSKQLGFLVKNLDYKHQEGRQSVMEAIHLLFTKVGEDLVQEIVGTFFVPLVIALVNDESSECREMAGALLKTSFNRADAERTQAFVNLLRSWLGQLDQPLLTRAALQAYTMYLDTNGEKAEKEVPQLQTRLAQIFKINLKDLASTDWELLYFSLQTFAKICRLFPAFVFAAAAAPLWSKVRQCLSFPHAWVKLSAARLLGTYFADFARTNANTETTELPMKGSDGLWLSHQEIVILTRASLGLLKVPNVSEELANQSVRNLVFLGKIMAQTSLLWPQRPSQSAPDLAEALDPDSDPEDEVLESTSRTKTALSHLMATASNILRRPPLTTRASSLTPLTSSLALLFALSTHLPILILTPLTPTILLPLHNLTDPAIPPPFSTDPAFVEGYKTLVTNSQELMSLLQRKLGTTVYINLLTQVREGVKGRREERRIKRRVEAVGEPERAGLMKRRKGEKKREKRKERSGEERGRRRGW